jgi:hypothetical protein
MSLTSHLRTRQSPVRVWFERNLGSTRPVVAEWNDELCGAPREPCLIQSPAECDAGLVGTAVDYLVRSVLRPDALERTVATKGAERIRRPAGVRLEREAADAIRVLHPWESRPVGNELEQMCRLCLVLARFEQCFRAGPDVAMKYVIDDLIRLGRAAIDDHIGLRSCESLVLNPTFALSAGLGGADADLVADGLLWDLKSTADPKSVVGRNDLWQLAGYALADLDDVHNIDWVGISALRRRSELAWPLDKLLFDLSGGVSAPVTRWRREFERVVSEVSVTRSAAGRRR